MAHTNSAKKRIRSGEKRRMRNKMYKTGLKTQLKKFLSVLEKAQSREQVEPILRATVSMLDSLAGKGIIKKGHASRKKSRIYKRVNSIGVNAN